MKAKGIQKVRVIAKNHNYTVSVNGKTILKDYKANDITEAINKAVDTL